MATQPRRKARGRNSAEIQRKYLPLFADRRSSRWRDLKSESLVTIQMLLSSIPIHVRRATIAPIPFPRDLSERREGLPQATVSAEINWTAAVLLEFAQELTQFSFLRQRFDSALLRGALDEADTTLDAVVASLGTSLWASEATLVLAEHQHGLAKNRSRLLEMTEAAGWPFRTFLPWLSHRSEAQLSASNFESSFDSFIQELSADGDITSAIDYLRLRLHPGSLRRSTHFDDCFSFESWNPIVDRYLQFVRFLQLAIATPKLREGDEIQRAIKHAVRALGAIPDPQVRVLQHVVFPQTPVEPNSPEREFAAAVENYTIGDYAACIAAASSVARTSPESVEVLELLVRASLHIGATVPKLFPEKAIAQKLLNHLFEVNAVGREFVASAEALRGLALSLDSTSAGAAVLGRAYANAGHQFTIFAPGRLAKLSSKYLTPRLADTLDTAADREAYFDSLEGAYGPSQTTALFRSVDATERLAKLRNIPLARKQMYTGQAHLRGGDPGRALDEFLAVVQTPPRSPSTLRTAVGAAAACLLELGKFDDCANLIAHHYLENPNMVAPEVFRTTISAAELTPANTDPRLITWPLVYHAHATLWHDRQGQRICRLRPIP